MRNLLHAKLRIYIISYNCYRQCICMLFQHRQCALVIGFVGDFLDELLIEDFSVGVNDYHGSCKQSGQRAVTELYAVFLSEKR